VVSQDVTTVDSDSLLPLKAALGHDVAQNLTLGPDKEPIEGTSDFANLQTTRDYLVCTAGNAHGTLARNQQHGSSWRFWDHDGWWRFWDRERL
jgi:hypothetical protein